jgi:PIN domain nuclease of toxin-antitoxin system
MRLLIDTHIFLWAMSGQLTKKAETILLDAETVFVSAASIWEIAIKSGLGKLDADVNELAARMSEAGFRELPVTAAHAAAVRDLPEIHRDPFDRLLIAQAMTEPLRLLTDDDTVGRYSDLVITI